MSEKCDVCGGSGGTHVRSKNYNDLYLTILRIGQSRVHEGLNYRQLLELLKVHGYDVENDCIVLAIKYWFYNSFYHLPDKDKPCRGIEDLDSHSDCNFILKGESSLVLIEHETMEKSIRQSKVAIRWAVFAIIIALITIPEVHDTIFGLFKTKNTTLQQPKPTKPTEAQTSPSLFDLAKLDTSLKNAPNKTTKKDTSSR